MRKALGATLIAAALVAALGTPASASIRFLARKVGTTKVSTKAWTRNYNAVAFVVETHGAPVGVYATVSCNGGYHRALNWADANGRTVRWVRIPNWAGKCNEAISAVTATGRRLGVFIAVRR